ncbi:MAG: class I SAM-dependent methyltransferase [Anaerolineales bacterium]|nr:class I SAM-dependent methyltransferase [Anaerolineales bacterium]MDW8278023.1 class I SAM-dependent methyltransferase [Anaerolineales bacterium]
MPALFLKPEREKSLLRRHPWVFSGAVERVSGDPRPGETVDVCNARGQWLARAAYSPVSQIRARVWTFDPDEAVDADFFRRRIHAALQRRAVLGFSPVPQTGERPAHVTTDAFRLVHAESDGLPGLVVDRYGDVLVLQSLTAGSDFWRETLADLLMEATGAVALYERSDADVRALEGLAPRVGILRGVWHSPRLSIYEHGLNVWVDVERGHKTGFYLDQRTNRKRVGEMAQGRDVLNCFCYTGGFTLHAAAGGANSVLSVDTSAEALALARENARQNALPSDRLDWLEADVFTALRKFRDQNRSWDLIILDPPKFAPTAAQAEKAARGYKDINRLAFKLLRPGGILVTFSCSGGIDAALFQKIVASAALDAGVDAQIVEHLSQAPDHPVALHFPEGAYLKGLVCIKCD